MAFLQLQQYLEQQVEPFMSVVRQHNGLGAHEKYASLFVPDMLWQQFHAEQVFGHNIIHALYFGGRQAYVPRSVVLAYRQILNAAPQGIKDSICALFAQRIQDLGWDKAVAHFLEEQCAYRGPWRVQEVRDFSIGAGVYCLHILLVQKKITVAVFFKRQFGADHTLRNEPFYHLIQRRMLQHPQEHPCPYYYDNSKGPSVLLSLPFPGVSADVELGAIHRRVLGQKGQADPTVWDNIMVCVMRHAALGDVLGRNDRHWGNAHMVWHEGKKDLWMIDFDIQYLLRSHNYSWIYEDLRQGTSEANLLALMEPTFSKEHWDDSVMRRILTMDAVYVEMLHHVLSESQRPWIKDHLVKSYGKEQGLAMNDMFLSCADDIFEGIWLENYYTALLQDYRYRLMVKDTLYHVASSGQDLGEWQRYVVSCDVEGAMTLLEAFRGVNSERFVREHSLKKRLCWEELEAQIMSSLTEQDRQQLLRKKAMCHQDAKWAIEQIRHHRK